MDKSEALASFQAVTGKDDLDECERILENHDWDLEKAVQTALAMGDDFSSSRPAPSSSSPPSSSFSAPVSSPSSSSSRQQPAHRNPHVQSSSGQSRSSEGLRRPQRVQSAFNPLRIFQEIFHWVIGLIWSFSRVLNFERITGTTVRREDPSAESARFLLNFEQKYGTTHPAFQNGSYENALREAQSHFRFLLVYLHCETHQDTDSFCRQTLCSPEVIQVLNDRNIILWAGNITQPQGSKVASALGAASYPFFALICSQGGSMAVVHRIEEALPPSAFNERLANAMQRFGGSLSEARRERERRDSERQLREQQEREYQESLLADQERERKEREEREAKERAEAQRKREEEERVQRQREILESRKLRAHRLAPEPSDKEPGSLLIAFRLMDSSKPKRRFRETDKVEALYDFVASQSEAIGTKEFVLCTAYPKTFLRDPNLTLREVPLSNNALLVAEEVF